MSTPITRSLAGLIFLVVGALHAEAGPTGSPPGAEQFRIGALAAWSLHDGQFDPPNDGATFGLGEPPAAVASVLRQAGAPTDRILLSVNDLLVKSPGHVMLFDTGLGPKMHGSLMSSLALTGVRPGDVTDILITHTHGDHVGGLVTADRKLAFPNATIRMSAREWAWMRGQPNAAGLATIIAPKVVTFEPGAPVLPGVTPVAIPGHTPGHVGYRIVSGDARLFDFGDTAHSFIISLAKPDWTIEFDTDKSVGAASRRAELARLASSRDPVFAPHFPFPGLGKVSKSGDGFVWKPDVMKIAVGGRVELIEASCHCGLVRLEITTPPTEVTDCNCSICRRYGVLWAYYSPANVHVSPVNSGADIYMWDDRSIEFHRCKTCGCVTHWAAVDKSRDRMGVNARLMDPSVLAAARVRHLDGAASWEVSD